MSSKEKTYQIFIRGFSRNTGKYELKECFKKYGKLRDINVKTGYAFVDFDQQYEAEDAVEGMNGKEIDGHKLVVELATRDKTKRRGPLGEDECWQCGKKGHWKTECPQYRKRPPRDDRDRDRGKYDRGRKNSSSPDRDRRRHKRRSSSSSRDARRRSRSRDKKDKKHRKRVPSSSSSSSRRKSSRSGS